MLYKSNGGRIYGDRCSPPHLKEQLFKNLASRLTMMAQGVTIAPLDDTGHGFQTIVSIAEPVWGVGKLSGVLWLWS
jgi:hypothetical protein